MMIWPEVSVFLGEVNPTQIRSNQKAERRNTYRGKRVVCNDNICQGVTSDPGITENIEQMLTLRTCIPFGANATRVAT